MLIKTAGWNWGSTLTGKANLTKSVSKVNTLFKGRNTAAFKLKPVGGRTKQFGAGQALMKKLLPKEARSAQTATNMAGEEAIKFKGVNAPKTPTAPNMGVPKPTMSKSAVQGVAVKPKTPGVPGGKMANSIGMPTINLNSPLNKQQRLLNKAMAKDKKIFNPINENFIPKVRA